jgi:hypothetical protein
MGHADISQISLAPGDLNGFLVEICSEVNS